MCDLISKNELWIAVLAILLTVNACARRYTVHPGALNSGDSAAYDALLIAETTIDQAKAALDDGRLPAAARGPLNSLIQSYEVARKAWLTYRGALATNTPSDLYFDNLTKNLADLENSIRAFKEAP